MFAQIDAVKEVEPSFDQAFPAYGSSFGAFEGGRWEA